MGESILKKGFLFSCRLNRNLSDAEDGFLRGKKYLRMDRDTKFSEAFRVTLEQTTGIRNP